MIPATLSALTAPGYLSGQETVTLLGMTEEGRLSFNCKRSPHSGVDPAQKGRLSQPGIESIHIDTTDRTVQVTWKSAINIQGQIESLRTIEARIL